MVKNNGIINAVRTHHKSANSMTETISQRMKAIPAEHYQAFRREVIDRTGYSTATYHNVYHGKNIPRYDKALIIISILEKHLTN